MSNDLPPEVINNIQNENFCGPEYYIQKTVNPKNISEQCKRCPPGKDDWYVDEPPGTVPPNKNVTDTQLTQLKAKRLIAGQYLT